jgi:hypothetical protein
VTIVDNSSFDKLPPMVSICIPPLLKEVAQKVAKEQPPVHPAWQKIGQRGRHFVLQTADICDIEELADWAKSWLEEPCEPLNKVKRQAFQNVITRAGKHVVLKPIGNCHFLAVGWRKR